MMRGGSGFARHRDPVETALDASLMAADRLAGGHADACVVVATAAACPGANGMLHGARRATGARTVVSCSGAGVLTEGGEREGAGLAEGETALAVLAMASDEVSLTPFLVDETEGLGIAAGTVAGARAFQGAGGQGLVVALPNARLLDPREMLEGIRATGGPMPVVGGVAVGARLFEFFNTEVVEGAMRGFALSGRRPAVGVHACTGVLVVVPEDGPRGAA